MTGDREGRKSKGDPISSLVVLGYMRSMLAFVAAMITKNRSGLLATLRSGERRDKAHRVFRLAEVRSGKKKRNSCQLYRLTSDDTESIWDYLVHSVQLRVEVLRQPAGKEDLRLIGLVFRLTSMAASGSSSPCPW
jgi:hypothetical protein